ncbi:unnamed protein product [Bemisia tabaci]|uniref:Uncharacterized protein n=1 Tax=Bemisia tabaci TaxID=7038 RepID=A0A9P0F7R2_BEMTA|nr:unnamed protein product [Bemisia tabaci]
MRSLGPIFRQYVNEGYIFLRDVNEGYIFLREGTNFDRGEIQTILWMARSGYRVASAAGACIPHMCYVMWPSVNICLLLYGEAPAAGWPGNVAAAALTSQQLLTFASSLANSRREHYSYCRGVYYALDVIGVRYATRGQDNAARHYRMGQFRNLEPISVPTPSDLHPFYRAMGKLPLEDDAHGRKEVECFLAYSGLTWVQLACTYVSLIMKFSTTYLFSMSLTTTKIVTFLNGAIPQAAANVLVRQACEPQTGGAEL